MPHKITVTAKTGPGLSVTALVVNNVVDINFDLKAMVLHVLNDVGRKEFDLDNIVTVTFTIASKTYTVTVTS